MVRIFSAAADDLLRQLRAEGYKLELRPRGLWVSPPPPEELAERIRASKPGLVDLVEAGEHRWRPVESGHVELVKIGSDLWAVRTWAGGSQAWYVRRLEGSREETEKRNRGWTVSK